MPYEKSNVMLRLNGMLSLPRQKFGGHFASMTSVQHTIVERGEYRALLVALFCLGLCPCGNLSNDLQGLPSKGAMQT
jgi:hypothetical protein